MTLTHKHMDRLDREDLKALLEDEGPQRVSLYLPTHRKGAEIQQDPIRLKNLLREAEEALEAEGAGPEAIKRVLAPVRPLLKDESFWQEQSDGLALFLTPERQRRFRFPLDFAELAQVGRRFHVKPLLPLLEGDGRFYVLALDQGGVQLLQGTKYSVSRVELQDVPRSLAEALQYDLVEKSVQFHTQTAPAQRGGQRAAVFHGQGGGNEADDKAKILEFFRHLDNGVCDLLEAERAPLVLLGLDHLQALYREANEYGFLMDDGVDRSPHQLKPEAIHGLAWEVVRPYFERERAQAADRFLQLKGNEHESALDELEALIPAAFDRRVETLFVPVNRQRWGRFDPQARELAVHDAPQPGDEDLFDFAVVHAWLNGGTVYAAAPEDVPGGGEVAAVLRY